MGIPDHLTRLLRNCMQVKKQQLEPDMEKWTGSKLEKEYIKAVYCHPAYLTYMQNSSCEMPGWMKLKLESRLLGEISTTSNMPIMSESEEKLKSLLIRLKEERGTAGLKVNFIKLISWQPVLYFMANRWGRSGNSDILFYWAQKSPWTVIAAMKLKDPCSLEGRL